VVSDSSSDEWNVQPVMKPTIYRCDE
jgi:hypothetical protein